MKRVLQLCEIFIAMAVIFALAELGFTLRQVRKDETLLASQYSEIGRHADETLTQVESEVPIAKERFGSESRLISDTTNRVRKFLDATQVQLDGGKPCLECAQVEGALPAAASALDAAAHLADAGGSGMQSAGIALTETQKEIQPILSNLALSSNQLATQLPPILASVNSSLEHTATGTAELAQASANVDASTKDVRDIADKIHDDFMHPTHRLWHYFLTALGIASDAGNASKL